jgi:hypothetical protein
MAAQIQGLVRQGMLLGIRLVFALEQKVIDFGQCFLFFLIFI